MVTVRGWLIAIRLASVRDRLAQAGFLDPPWWSRHGVALWLSTFLLTCNLYLLATVMPAVVRSLHVGVSAVEAALILFPLIAGLLVPVGRQVLGAYGRRRVINGAAIMFGAGLLLAAGSVSAAMLIVGYSLVGGMAGAVLLAAAWSLLDETQSPESRAVGAALLGTAPLAGSIVGPALGGLVAQETTWRLAFIPELALVAVIMVELRSLPASQGASLMTVRWINSLVGLIGVAFVVVGVGLADDYGWWNAVRPLGLGAVQASPFGLSVAPLLIGVGVLVLVLGGVQTARLRFAAYMRPRFASALLISVAVGTSTMGLLYALLLLFTIGARLNQIEVGLAVIPFGLGAVLINVGVIFTQRPHNAAIAVGAGIIISCAGIGLLLFGIATWGAGWGSAPGLFVLGLGNGLALSRLTTLTLSYLGSTQQSEASAINAGAGDLAYALGIAILGAVFVGVAAHGLVSGVEQQAGVTVPPAQRQQLVSHLEDDLRTLTPERQDAFIESQPEPIRTAIRSVADTAFQQGINAVLETALGGLGLSLVVLVATTRVKD